MSGLAQKALLLQSGYNSRILGISPGNLIGYWPLNETSGTVAADYSATAANGAYAGTVTLNGGTIGNSQAASFGGGRVSLATAITALNTVFNGNAGTVMIWCKVANAGVWTDGALRVALEFGADVSNRILINKSTVNNQFNIQRIHGGTATVIATISPTVWFQVVATWDSTANEFKAFINGVQTGATQTMSAWSATLASGFTAIGDFTSAGANPWSGYLAHCAAWKTTLTPQRIAALYVPALAA